MQTNIFVSILVSIDVKELLLFYEEIKIRKFFKYRRTKVAKALYILYIDILTDTSHNASNISLLVLDFPFEKGVSICPKQT